MEGVDLTQLYTTIGSILGTPAALAFFWAVTRIRDLQAKVKELEAENNSAKADLTKIREDVSFMRGMMEGKEKLTREKIS